MWKFKAGVRAIDRRIKQSCERKKTAFPGSLQYQSLDPRKLRSRLTNERSPDGFAPVATVAAASLVAFSGGFAVSVLRG